LKESKDLALIASMEKKKQDTYNLQNLNVNKVPITTNPTQEYKQKITPLNLNLKHFDGDTTY
jgi:hypothetical protein